MRTLSLWRSDAPESAPSLDALRAFATATLRDDALVIVAARPPRPEPRPGPARDARPRGR